MKQEYYLKGGRYNDSHVVWEPPIPLNAALMLHDGEYYINRGYSILIDRKMLPILEYRGRRNGTT